MSALIKHEEQKQELDYLRNLALIAAKSGNHGDKSQETMLNIMLTAKDLGISPMKALNGGFYVVNGKIGMSTALMADRIRKEGHSIKIPEWTSEKCTVIGIRKDNGDSIKFEFTMQDAQLANLTNSPTWKKYPKHMLYNRAMSTLARTLFPDVVGNAYSEDERYDLLNIPPSKRPEEDPDTIIMTTRAEEVTPETEEALLGKLKSFMDIEGIPSERLQEWIKKRCEAKSSQDPASILKACLEKDVLPKVKVAYAKWLNETVEIAV